jgi:hypothetical protein
VAALPHDTGAGPTSLCQDSAAVVRLVRPPLSRMRPCFGSNALSAIVRLRRKYLVPNESVSMRRNFKMRNSDRYMSMTYRAICADDYGDAQFVANNINDLHAQLRSPFISIFLQPTLRSLEIRHFSGELAQVHSSGGFPSGS